MRVTWSPRALDAAVRIVARIIEDGRPQAAVDWLDGLERRVDLLREAPLQGRVVPEWIDAQMRELIYKGSRIIYSPRDAEIEIVTIRHSREELTGSGTEDSS